MVEVSLVVIFAIVASIHAIWALRIWWPIADEARLAKSVVGASGITKMPSSSAAWGVVFVIMIGIYWVAILAGWTETSMPEWLVQLGGWAMAGILLIRGALSYVFDHRLKQEAQFRFLNLRFYSPLILLLGAGVMSLLL